MINIVVNYASIYNTIIERAKRRVEPTCYFEKHHIIPRSMGGSDEKDNLVKLTVKEHRVCHVLLYRLFRDEYPNLIYAVYKFYDDPNKHRIALKRKKPMAGWLRRCKTLRDAFHRRELGRKMVERWNSSPQKIRNIEIDD